MFSTSNPGAGMHRKEMKMGDRFLELLLSGMKRFVSALGTYLESAHDTPPPKVEAERDLHRSVVRNAMGILPS